MNWIKEQLSHTNPPDLLVHLGAGTCRELEHWLTSGAQRIVLVEPNPELLPILCERTEDMDHVEVIATAVAEKAGEGQLRLFNFPGLSSLREPTGLYHSLPGLRQVGSVTVEHLTMEQLLERVGIDAQATNWLIIDAPGQEAVVLDQLQASDRLQHFGRIFLRAGIEPLYEYAKSASDLLSQLQAQGYEPVSQPDVGDAEWPRYHLRLDRLALECQRLQSEVAERSQREAEVMAELRSAEENLLSAQKLLSEEKSTNRKLSAQLDEKTAESESLKKSLAQLKAAKQHYEKLANEQARQLEERKKEQADLDERQRLLDTEMQRAEAQIDLIKDVLIREKNF